MSERKKGGGADSFDDSESIFLSDTVHLHELPSISPRRLAYIIRRAFHYSRPPFALLGIGGVWHYASKSSDYDGWPFIDAWQLRCMPGGARPYGSDPVLWIARISYDSWGTDKGEPDYEAMATPGREFRGMRGPDLAKFYFNDRYSITCYSLAKGGAERVATDLIALESQLMAWDKNTETLDAWAKSGMDMLGLCNSGCILDFDHCGHIGVISNAVVASAAEQSMTLEVFRSRLRCKQCGKRNVQVSPPVLADLVERQLQSPAERGPEA